MAFNSPTIPGFSNFNNIDPAFLVQPPPPQHLTVKLLSDNVTIQISAVVQPFSRFNPGFTVTLDLPIYFTPASAVNPSALTTPAQQAAAFAKASQVASMRAPQTGGIVSTTVNGGALGPGVFWVTVVNPRAFGELESTPAGPAFLDQEAEARLITSVAPAAVTLAFIPSINRLSIPYSDLLYVTLFQAGYFPPDPPGSFVGVIPYLVGYFSNFALSGFPSVIEGPYFPYDGKPIDPIFGTTFTWEGIQADYNSTGAGDYLIAHDVKLYVVSVSSGFTYQPPITSHPFWDFPNGIGS